MTPDQTIRRAERMAEFLDDEDVRAVFADLERGYVEEWKNSLPVSHNVWFKVRALRDVIAKLGEVRDAGKVAEDTLQRQRREARADDPQKLERDAREE